MTLRDERLLCAAFRESEDSGSDPTRDWLISSRRATGVF